MQPLGRTVTQAFQRGVIASVCLWLAALALGIGCLARRRPAWAWLAVSTLGLAGWALAGGASSGAFWVALAGSFAVSIASHHTRWAGAVFEAPARAWLGGGAQGRDPEPWPVPRTRWEAELASDSPDWSSDPQRDTEALPPPSPRPDWLEAPPTARGELAERLALALRAALYRLRSPKGGPRNAHARAFDRAAARWRWAARSFGDRPGRRRELRETQSWLAHGSLRLRRAGRFPEARARWESEWALRQASRCLERGLTWRPRGRLLPLLAAPWNRAVAPRLIRAPRRNPALEAELAQLERLRPRPTPRDLPLVLLAHQAPALPGHLATALPAHLATALLTPQAQGPVGGANPDSAEPLTHKRARPGAEDPSRA